MCLEASLWKLYLVQEYKQIFHQPVLLNGDEAVFGKVGNLLVFDDLQAPVQGYQTAYVLTAELEVAHVMDGLAQAVLAD
jgi:hypothetical protein